MESVSAAGKKTPDTCVDADYTGKATPSFDMTNRARAIAVGAPATATSLSYARGTEHGAGASRRFFFTDIWRRFILAGPLDSGTMTILAKSR